MYFHEKLSVRSLPKHLLDADFFFAGDRGCNVDTAMAAKCSPEVTFLTPFPHESFTNDYHSPSAGLEAVLIDCVRRNSSGMLTIVCPVFWARQNLVVSLAFLCELLHNHFRLQETAVNKLIDCHGWRNYGSIDALT